ncbi:ABC transporter ATP-binding protein [Silicimonas algicola]|uniref:ATP-binding cassette subfamily B protein n=1 Tax=Silicimonas algicola TaxID=1826607 RepID=A0A316G1X5_9RHOB|nr:ABC transporter ATP-binding protein [Silicimonas algicola]AZQ68235.1 ABC transporter ATP-binding protein [Silicimonas algicola]PWK54633.1 ATP-binding cassette subfamily B protein [Silicimonas algicola]
MSRDPLRSDALWRLVRRMAPQLRPHRRRLVLGGLALIGVAASEVARPWPLKVVFDGILMPRPDTDPVTGWMTATFGTGDGLLAATAFAILAIALVGGAAGFAQAYLIASVGQKVVAQIRLDLYRHVQRLSHSFHDTASSGDIIARLTGDVRMMRDLLIDAVVFFAARVLVIGATVGVMAWMDWRLTLSALAILPALWLVTRHFGGRIRGAARRQRRKEGKIAVVMTEGISSIDVVKGFAREAYEESRFAKQNNSSAEAGVVTTRLAANMDRVTQVILALGTALVLWYGVVRVRSGAISPGDLLVFTAYLSTLYKPVRKMAAMTARVAKATASGERLLEIFDLSPEVAERPGAVDAGLLAGRVGFANVTFAYPGSPPVLRNAYLNLNPGEIVAIVGTSGIGKSSATRLIMRFYDPQEGSVRIDGHDIREFTLDTLRGNISVVLQDSVLFGTTVRDSIAYGRLDATEDEIVAAAREAEADGFIRLLPEGYDTVLGERGETLSGGQRQRITIARAVLRDAPILILDEPLTGLDPATARSLLGGLRRAAAGRTTFLIAHDALTLSLASRVVRIEDGQFVEYPRNSRILSA